MHSQVYVLTILFCVMFGSSTIITDYNGECVQLPPMCKKFIDPNYKQMRLPNMLNHTRYKDVASGIRIWKPLLNSTTCNAGHQLNYFLCFTYAPVCVSQLVTPCKSLCVTVRDSCSPIMEKYNYTWPSFFDCAQSDKFHEESSNMCISLKMMSTRKKCSCKNGYSRKKFKSLLCKSDFVFTGWVVKPMNKSRIEVVASSFIKPEHGTPKLERSSRLELVVVNSKKNCRCDRLRVKKKPRGNGVYLILANKMDGTMHVEAMKRIHKESKDIAALMNVCEGQ